MIFLKAPRWPRVCQAWAPLDGWNGSESVINWHEAAFFPSSNWVKKSMTVGSPSHFYVETLYNFKASQKVVSTREFLWDIIKGFMVNWWAELMVSIKADWTSKFRQINKVTKVEVQISSLTSSFLSFTRQALVVIKSTLSFLHWSSVNGPVLIKTWVYSERHRRRGI